jgi:hypothetical protein
VSEHHEQEHPMPPISTTPADRLAQVADELRSMALNVDRLVSSRIYLDRADDPYLVVELGIGVQSLEVDYLPGEEVPYRVVYRAFRHPDDETESLLGTAVSPRMAAGIVWAAMTEDREETERLNAALASSETQAHQG